MGVDPRMRVEFGTETGREWEWVGVGKGTGGGGLKGGATHWRRKTGCPRRRAGRGV